MQEGHKFPCLLWGGDTFNERFFVRGPGVGGSPPRNPKVLGRVCTIHDVLVFKGVCVWLVSVVFTMCIALVEDVSRCCCASASFLHESVPGT